MPQLLIYGVVLMGAFVTRELIHQQTIRTRTDSLCRLKDAGFSDPFCSQEGESWNKHHLTISEQSKEFLATKILPGTRDKFPMLGRKR